MYQIATQNKLNLSSCSLTTSLYLLGRNLNLKHYHSPLTPVPRLSLLVEDVRVAGADVRVAGAGDGGRFVFVVGVL